MLGAGGVLGGAWLTGALHAIARETGWDPGSADHIVGTSAGSMIGALLACGVPPWYMVAHSAGEELDGLRDARGEAGLVRRPLRRREIPAAPRSAGARPGLVATRASHRSPVRTGTRPRRSSPAGCRAARSRPSR